VSDKRIQPWRVLKVGQRVRLTGKWRKGWTGTIAERLDDLITGMARYAVRLDADANPGNASDLCRFELTPEK
jgi:hypothetical protein